MKDKVATVIVDLERSEREIFEDLNKDARYGIRLAMREGLALCIPSPNEVYEMYSDSMRQFRLPYDSKEEMCKKMVAWFGVKKGKDLIGVAAIELRDNRPILYLNASHKEYRSSQPNNLLYWACIIWSKNKGYKQFDLGGWQIKARGNLVGVNKFKERWGRVVYYEEDFPFLHAIARKAIRQSNLLWILRNKVRRTNGNV